MDLTQTKHLYLNYIKENYINPYYSTRLYREDVYNIIINKVVSNASLEAANPCMFNADFSQSIFLKETIAYTLTQLKDSIIEDLRLELELELGAKRDIALDNSISRLLNRESIIRNANKTNFKDKGFILVSEVNIKKYTIIHVYLAENNIIDNLENEFIKRTNTINEITDYITKEVDKNTIVKLGKNLKIKEDPDYSEFVEEDPIKILKESIKYDKEESIITARNIKEEWESNVDNKIIIMSNGPEYSAEAMEEKDINNCLERYIKARHEKKNPSDRNNSR